jgi:hypothetical protein
VAFRRVSLFGGLLLCAACTISTSVQPVPSGDIQAVCIKENPATWSEGFLPALRAQFERRRIATATYVQYPPAECRYRVEYDANWGWDVAIYLKYADIRILDGDRLIGRATYDARGAWGRVDKFGSTDAKLDQLMDRLLSGTGGGDL